VSNISALHPRWTHASFEIKTSGSPVPLVLAQPTALHPSASPAIKGIVPRNRTNSAQRNAILPV